MVVVAVVVAVAVGVAVVVVVIFNKQGSKMSNLDYRSIEWVHADGAQCLCGDPVACHCGHPQCPGWRDGDATQCDLLEDRDPFVVDEEALNTAAAHGLLTTATTGDDE